MPKELDAGLKVLILADAIPRFKRPFTEEEFVAALIKIYRRGLIEFPGAGAIQLTAEGEIALSRYGSPAFLARSKRLPWLRGFTK